MREPTPEAIDAFIAKWSHSGGHERGSGQYFLLDFCDLLGLEKPAAPLPENALNAYTFERRVERRKPDGTSSPNWIDLYKSAHFVLETKQGVNPRRDKSDPDQPLLPDLDTTPANTSLGHGQRGSATWDKSLDRAHSQAERYIHLLPASEGRPPFIIVCDVGHCFDIYAEFSGTGGQYEAFPTPRKRRIHLKDLHDPEIRELFRRIWTDPHSLDPSKHAAKVTRKVARTLADLAKSLEKDGHDPQVTAGFLQRCLFTMFAEDVELLPKNSFKNLLDKFRTDSSGLVTLLRALWREMSEGPAMSLVLQSKIPHFNGGLFKDATALPLRPDQIAYLIHAANQDWSAVEPAIFGTLLERALDSRERHKLGAHYTPRSYVERLVRPTLIDPLRAEWDAVKIAAAQLDDKGKAKEARAAVEAFHNKLAAVRVLDPACGSGNFLYVALELLKRLEAEVLDLFENLGGDRRLEMDKAIIRPTNFLGIELNPRAAAIAQLVLWIGYFQWHQRTTGKADTNDRPLLPKDNTIECRDAVLAYDGKIPRRDPGTGEILTIWDGRSTKQHPVTGREVPDESARTVLFDYVNPRRAEWPQADYIVGNPPFIGNKRMRDALGSGYVDALRNAWRSAKPNSWDFVMFWWHNAAEMVSAKKTAIFGLITTNSIHQSSNRVVLESAMGAKKGCHITYAIPDHPWVDSADGAAVRISMTVASSGLGTGHLQKVVNEVEEPDGEHIVTLTSETGTIGPDLKIGASTTEAIQLRSNDDVCFQGMNLVGEGFRIGNDEIEAMAYTIASLPPCVRPYQKGRELLQNGDCGWVLDCFGLTADQLAEHYPPVYQHLLVHVKPERDHNKRKSRKDRWWLFGEPVGKLRKALIGLDRYIATVETSKHKPFVFIPAATIPDHKLYAIASADAWLLGCLSAAPHQLWALRAGGRLGFGNDPTWTNTTTFKPFPFPALEEGPLKQRIRDLGERLDAHRKARQAAHPELTLTGIYNVLEKLRAGEALNDKEKKIHDQGLVTILKQIHDDLDQAVLEAYGWGDLAVETQDTRQEQAREELLGRLVALNHERAAEEKRGLVRWLRPEYQNPGHGGLAAPTSQDLPGTEADSSLETENLKLETLSWPQGLSEQVSAIRALLPANGPDPAALAGRFGKRTKARIQQIHEILETLRALGKM
ncbi:MAG: class I SAM-dependent DNA methyltransferase [Verrucomicrobia bacterium]|nr:class I SAM-dependent DNA methyltransferase [Verrucomicrobiota bacterium]